MIGEVMSELGTFEACRAALRMSVPGVDRKWSADGQDDAIDPYRKSRHPINCRRRIEYATRIGPGGQLIGVM
jgi:hypothetical protein